jgi:hypothetical protein
MKTSNRLVQARVALDRGDADGAVLHARRAVELTPLAWLAHFRLGVALGAAGVVAEAIAECAIAAQLASSATEIELAKVEIGIITPTATRKRVLISKTYTPQQRRHRRTCYTTSASCGCAAVCSPRRSMHSRR